MLHKNEDGNFFTNIAALEKIGNMFVFTLLSNITYDTVDNTGYSVGKKCTVGVSANTNR